jgi:hypothetical protein
MGGVEILGHGIKGRHQARTSYSRRRPTGIFSDTCFESKGSFLRGNGSMPSGHTLAAFSVATIVAHRYGNHPWVPYVSYGMAALVGFSRLTLSAHFVSDVFSTPFAIAVGRSPGRAKMPGGNACQGFCPKTVKHPKWLDVQSHRRLQ